MILVFLLLSGLLATTLFGRLFLERRLALAPTATLTRAPKNTDTPTVDFRATINIAEIITQAAYRSALIGITTPTRDVTATPGATASPTGETDTPEPTRTAVIHVPNISGGSDATPTPVPPSITTPTITNTPNPFAVQTPTPIPGEATQTAVAGLTATALLFTPTSTDTPIPTATPTEAIVGAPPVATLQAVTKNRNDIKVYAGPGVLYGYITTLPQDLTVRLEGRTPTGEWVRLCCVNNVDGWARQAYFTITGNSAPPGAPAGASGNDVRWLALQQSTAAPLTPQPTATAIPPGNFPLYRRDAAGTGRVDSNFRLPLINGWPASSQASAGDSFSSPPVIVGSTVLAASQDLHIYSFDSERGNQRWRINLNTIIKFSPAVQDPYIYVVDQTGLLVALRDTGNATDAQVWRNPTNIAPSAPLNIFGDILYMPGTDNVLYAFNRFDGSRRWAYLAPPRRSLTYPAIGDQLIYAGDENLAALDVYSGTVVWEDSSVTGMAGPPVYAWPGVNGLAEVYAVDTQGIIHAFDANTGAAYWRKDSGDRPTALAVDDQMLYASGPGFVSARDRLTGTQRWRANLGGGEILGGPIVGNGRILIAGIGTPILVLDANTGGIVGSVPVVVNLAGSPAVSQQSIFLAGLDGQLYKFREQ
ncbi:MAG: PQQ-binding-like beta-propeller repeat protein [Caldilineaceae bacterium]